MNNKELLFDHLVGFQRKIAKLDKTINDQAEEFTLRQKELFGDLFTILDAFEHLEKNLESKNDTVEKSTRLIIKSTLKIKRKLLRILKDRDIEPLNFPDNQARMELCKVIATEKANQLTDGTIISIEKTGYIDIRQNLILRKAEVITALNQPLS